MEEQTPPPSSPKTVRPRVVTTPIKTGPGSPQVVEAVPVPPPTPPPAPTWESSPSNGRVVVATVAPKKQRLFPHGRAFFLAAALAMIIFGFFVMYDVEEGSIVRVDINAQWREIWDPPPRVKPNQHIDLQEMDIWDKWALTFECYFWDRSACRPKEGDPQNAMTRHSPSTRKVLHLPVPMARALHWWKRRIHSRIAEWRPIKHVAERVRIGFKTLLTPVRELRGLHMAFKEWLANVKNVSEGAGVLGSFIQKCKDVLERPKVKVFLKVLIRVIMPAAAATRFLPLLL